MTKFKALSFFKGAFVLLMIFAVILSGCSAKPDPADETSPESTQQDASGTEEVKPFEGYLAPDFELEDLSGQQVRLSALCGKTLVVNFWSLNCPDCLREMPEFDEFYASKASDVELLMVNMDPDESKVKEYIQNENYGFRVLMDKKAEAAKAYLIRGLPTTVVVGKDGRVKVRFEGPLTKELLDQLVIIEDLGQIRL